MNCEPIHILGVSAFYHDSAACLLRDGEIVAAAQEERFTRRKGDSSYPENAIAFCLEQAEIEGDQLAHVVFYDKPLLKFERILESYLSIAPAGFTSFLKAAPLWLKEKLHMGTALRRSLGYDGEILYAEHHESHAASAFYPSPFAESAILTIDGVGEWATASYGMGSDNEITLIKELHWPDSLGLLYSAFTYYTGFKVNSGEYKVMGLAPYGQPKYVDKILTDLVDLREDGSFRLNQKYFNYLGGLTMTSRAFDRLFGGPPRRPESPITQRDMDLARSVQDVCEEIVIRMARTAHAMTGSRNLCLAGGVALNCVANGRLLREGPFAGIWIQPAAGDAGGALGAAQLVWHRHLNSERSVNHRSDSMQGAYLGPEYSCEQIKEYLDSIGASYRKLSDSELVDRVGQHLADGRIVGWFSGRMEFGPRALGARSILGDPRNKEMQSQMNLKIKYRESFRPFAPSVLEDRVTEFFEMDVGSPYMLIVAPVQERRRIPMQNAESLWGIEMLNQPRSDIPAVTHVDYSARVQTVSRHHNERYYDLLKAFEQRTGCPVLVNTSFNVRGEPIVCTPRDAYQCFMRTDMDHLALGSFLLDKTSQPEWQEVDNWRAEFELD